MRKSMSPSVTYAWIPLLLVFFSHFAQAAENPAAIQNQYTLFSNHRTDYRIVLQADASSSEQWAAKELRHWLNEISGADFPIATAADTGSSSGPAIYLGYNERVAKQWHTANPADGDESFRYGSIGADILIVGGKERGTLYGVMSFLENEFGVRWYTPSVMVVPKKDEVKFITYDHSEKPGIRVRNDFYFEAFDTLWAARNRMNGRMGYVSQPGGVETYGNTHTFYPLVPPEEFFTKHPEYYSLVKGKRTHEAAQLCLTNPAVLKIVIARISQRMREHPEYLVYDVAQNDNFKPCQCDKCQRIAQQEGSESGPVIWFVNQVAAAVEKEFPDKYIGTLAYQYTRKPPKTLHPRENVIIRVCPFEVCSAHPLSVCPENKALMNDLEGWSAIAPHLYIWDYVVNFHNYIIPYPNMSVLQPNIRTFRENHAIGIMEEAAYQSRGGEFAELKTYLLARLLWNPDADPNAIIDDFMAGFYGRAGKYVRAYLDLLQSRITPDVHIHNGLKPEDSLFSTDLIGHSLNLFEQAKIVADNEEITHRVEMASLPVLYLYCKRYPTLARIDGRFEAFKHIVEREKVVYFHEGDFAGAEKDRLRFYQSVEEAK